MGLVDLIYPKRCVICKKTGDYLCTNCFSLLSFDTKESCLVCNKPTYNGLTHPICSGKYTIDGCFSAISYNKTAQKLIYNFKYKPYLKDLSLFLSELFYESIIQNENLALIMQKPFVNQKWIIVPIPLFSSKFKKRGYNQSEILAKNISKRLKMPTINLLKRTRDTKNQYKLKREDREINIKNAFVVNDSKFAIQNMSIFLIDDIVTTGSTLKEAANVLKRSGAKQVFGLILAKD